MLVARDLSKRFRDKQVLDGLDFAVARGEVVAVVGENGCGKSTLLKLCAGLLAPDRGTVSVTGAVGYCPQEPGLLSRLTIDEHLAVFGAGFGLSRQRARAVGRAHLAALGVPDAENAAVGTLSGGTRQKLNLALALLGQPQVLLLDEPYQGFDHGTYVDFWQLVGAWRTDGKAVVVITHLLAELSLADRVVDLASATSQPQPPGELLR